MIDHFGKEKKLKKKVEKLKMLPDSIKNEFLNAYFYRMKLRFRLKLL